MKRAILLMAVGALCAGCASGAGSPGTSARRPGVDPRLGRADELASRGEPAAARDLYEQIAREPVKDTAHAMALYGLARLHADPSHGAPDYAAALAAVDRLLGEYSTGSWDADARAWRSLLVTIQAREADATRLQNETTRLRADLRVREAEAARLRESMARLKDEMARLKSDLQQLKRIDLQLERRR